MIRPRKDARELASTYALNVTRQRGTIPGVDLALGVLAVAGLLLDRHGQRGGPMTVAAVAVAACTGAALSVRRHAPLPSFAATMGLLLAGLPLTHSSHAAEAVAVVSSSTVAYCERRRVAVLVAIALVPCVTIGFFEAQDGSDEWSTFGVYLFVTLAAVAAGDALRSRNEATQARDAAREIERAAYARAQYDEQRLELARDLHDSVGHALVAINTQAAVSAHLHRRDTDPAVLQSLSDIKEASARALDDLRLTVRELRMDVAAGEPATLTEDALEQLVRPLRARAIDVEISLDERVARGPQPPVQSASYRIVQESLTNVLRHSSATRVTVRIFCSDNAVEIEVRNDTISAPGPAHPGHGVLGMTERAAKLGGTLHAGPDGQGWLVRATLPSANTGRAETRALSHP